MSRTVSVKPIATLIEQCSQCGLWFEFLHPGVGGRDMCSVCIRLACHGGGSRGRGRGCASGRRVDSREPAKAASRWNRPGDLRSRHQASRRGPYRRRRCRRLNPV
jgi:hypothetical protein